MKGIILAVDLRSFQLSEPQLLNDVYYLTHSFLLLFVFLCFVLCFREEGEFSSMLNTLKWSPC